MLNTKENLSVEKKKCDGMFLVYFFVFTKLKSINKHIKIKRIKTFLFADLHYFTGTKIKTSTTKLGKV